MSNQSMRILGQKMTEAWGLLTMKGVPQKIISKIIKDAGIKTGS